MIDLVDFHSHILPGADHGSASVEESLDQLNLASAHEIKRIVATPHFYPDTHDISSFIARRQASYEALVVAMADSSPQIRLGAEVFMCEGLENMPELDKLFISGTSTLLLELPYFDFDYSLVRSVSTLVSSGVDVVLAHADRYQSESINLMLDAGARIQLNVDSLRSFFLPKHLIKWLELGKVVALGSDIHGRDQKAYRNFASAVSRISKYIGYIKEQSDIIWAKSC